MSSGGQPRQRRARLIGGHADLDVMERLKGGVATRSASEMRAVAADLGARLPSDSTLALHGDLGAGKTTFVQGLARGLGLSEPVSSPTFAIYSVHRGGRTRLIHLDAYRLENEAQLEPLLLEEFLVSPYCLAVEWPERIARWLPADALHLDLSIDSHGRHLVRLQDSQPEKTREGD